MLDLGGIFGIGQRALSTYQRAASVVSHNISNLSTPGFSRQEVVFIDGAVERLFGTGVEVQEVRRVTDRFLEGRIVLEQSTRERLEIEQRLLRRLEAVFQGTEEEGISSAITNFFAALHDVSNNPADEAPRIALIERGRELADRFRAASEQLASLRHDADGEIQIRVNEINALLTRIADLNFQIRNLDNKGEGTHDLQDERARLLTELSEKIEIQVIPNQEGAFTVVAGGSGNVAPLVMGEKAFSLFVTPNPDDPESVAIHSDFGGDITDVIANGSLAGLLALRDRLLPDYLNRLDRLAAVIVNEFNTQHRSGFNLEGVTGIPDDPLTGNFFAPLVSQKGLPVSTNRGNATVDLSIALLPSPLPDPLPVTPLPPENLKLTFADYELSFSQARYTLRNLSTGVMTTGEVVPDLVVQFEGMKITVSGQAAEGDRFLLRLHRGVAGAMAVSISDPRKIAAASSGETIPGDNGNALLLAALRDKPSVAFQDTFEEFYGAFVGEVGLRVERAQREFSVSEGVLTTLTTLREEVQGVSLDEEMTNLIQFQRAYQASAQLVTTADELLQTLLGMKR